ncbi:MAG: hypothetical protein U1E36_07625 [Rickettsiales bacterium]
MANNSSMNRLSLELRQSQTLVMTQQLQQSIKLLQLSSLELSDFLATEIEKNPLLSSSDGDEDFESGSEAGIPETSSPVSDEDEQAFDAPSSEDFLDTSEESWWGEDSGSRYGDAVDGRAIERDGEYYSPSDALEQRFSS